MSNRSHNGICRLCGTYGKLSYEHVPPRAAFNNRPLVAQAMDDLIRKGSDGAKSGAFQRGAGAYSLCERCNNLTGHWYGKAYVDWVYQGMLILGLASGKPSLYYNFHILPLRVLKQIVCMFFSVNDSRFQVAHKDLVGFVLNRERRHLPEGFRVLLFYAVGTTFRRSGFTVSMNVIDRRRNSMFSEITFPPFGYVLLLDSAAPFNNPPHAELLDISYFGKSDYNEFRSIPLRIPVLPIISYFPGDYRSQAEMDKDYEANMKSALPAA